jgi:hypothetical protein
MLAADSELIMDAVEQFAGFSRLECWPRSESFDDDISEEILTWAAFRAAVMKGPVEEIEFLGGLRQETSDKCTLKAEACLHRTAFLKAEYETWNRNLSKVMVLNYTYQSIPETLLDPCISGGALRVLKLRLFRSQDAKKYVSACASQCPHLECVVIDGGSTQSCFFFGIQFK